MTNGASGSRVLTPDTINNVEDWNAWSHVMVTRALFAVALLSANALISCTSQNDPYIEAYWNGCRAGREDTGGTIASYAARDDPRYSTDANYRKEWDNGFMICFNQKFLQTGH